MSTKIIKKYNQDLISRVALNCNDIDFKDFKQDLYGEAIYRAQKKIAMHYDLLERKVTVEVTSTDPVELPISDLKAITRIIVNNIRYKNRDKEADRETREEAWEEFTYRVYFDEDELWKLEYYNQQIGDEVTIEYTSIGNAPETETGDIILPEKYIEETVRIATLIIARWGIAKFMNLTKEKYISVVRTYERKSAKESQELEKDTNWIQIKPFIYP